MNKDFLLFKLYYLFLFVVSILSTIHLNGEFRYIFNYLIFKFPPTFKL